MIAEAGYLNARVGGMKSRLMTGPQMEEAVRSASVADFTARLRAAGYGPQLDRQAVRHRGSRVVELALTADYVEACRRLQKSCPPSMAPLLASLLAVWDWRNLITVLRALHHGKSFPDVEVALVPAGSLDGPALLELLSRENVQQACSLLATWNLPWATSLVETLPVYRDTKRLVWMEMAVVRGVLGQTIKKISGPGGNRALAREAVGRQVDLALVTTKLQFLDEGIAVDLKLPSEERRHRRRVRARAGRMAFRRWWKKRFPPLGAPLEGRGIKRPEPRSPVNRIPVRFRKIRPKDLVPPAGFEFHGRRLVSLMTAPDEAAVVHQLLHSSYAPALGREMIEMETIPDAAVLERNLEEHLVGRMVNLRRGRPLTLAPVISYLWMKWAEMVNLRIALRGLLYGMPPEAITGELYRVG